jgi:hypothetical protein
MIKRMDHTTVSSGDDVHEQTVGRAKDMRKLLRNLAGVQMWQVEEVQPRPGHRLPTIYYDVTTGSLVKTFSRPHEAWEYFQKLTNSPDAPGPPAKGHDRTGTS